MAVDEIKDKKSLLEFVKSTKQVCYIVVPNNNFRFSTKLNEVVVEAGQLDYSYRPVSISRSGLKIRITPCELKDAHFFLITDDVLEDVLLKYAYDDRGFPSLNGAMIAVANLKINLIGKVCLPIVKEDFIDDNTISFEVTRKVSNEFLKSIVDFGPIDGHSMRYKEQLKDERWFAFRRFVLLARGKRCEICGSKLSLQIHHPEYIEGRCAWEYTCNEVIVLCRKCHSKIHNKQ